ncbi:hypothetical protein V501_06122 [Pseudogymnoascus sp. VKM F-4519 (FW-2642)]|nr:hypothetical protein V501_06122 [Pseudogymnoascus sp. VKM F-4519 (FW-2642)]
MEVFQAQYIPDQEDPKPEHLFAGMATKALISSWPPVGQVTETSNGKISFTVLLETDEGGVSAAWEVAVWYSSGDSWKETPLTRKGALDKPKSVEGRFHSYFTGSLDTTSTITFTIKFKKAGEETWRWVKEHQGIGDGVVVWKGQAAPTAAVEDFAELIEDLNSEFKVQKVRSQSPGTELWSVEAPVASAEGEKSTFTSTKIGKPWSGDFVRWFALIRTWTAWLAPRQGSSFELDKEAIVCSFLEQRGGRHLVFLAVSGIDDVSALFRSDAAGNITLEARNDGPKAGIARIIVALGNDFESANAAAMYHARDLVQDLSLATSEEKQELMALKDDVKPQWMENWFDGLTYCTWNGLGQNLTEEKIYNAVDTLAANNINISNLIIDDNWQSVETPAGSENQFQQTWLEFEANTTGFPKGLKHTITNIRSKHPNIQHIAVWHSLIGYWGGISPNGKIAQNYKTVEVEREDSLPANLPMDGKMTLVAPSDVGKFYNDFYTFLTGCGIDAVKTDSQYLLDTITSASARASLTHAYLDAWSIAGLRHFSVKAISCMSQTPNIIFHSQLPSNRPPILVRNSDDFFPEIESSHAWHVFTNASNALLTQHLNVVPDFDMFMTVHEYSAFHAAARCVSGGPVYITDVPGEHNMPLINQMTGPTPAGKSVIFRPSTFGKTRDPYQGYQDPVLLKISTYHGAAVTGTGMLGLFNTTSRPVSELLHISLFPGVVEAQLYVVRSHVSGLVTPPLQVVDYRPESLIYASLDVRGYDILSAFPLRGFVRPSSKENDTLWVASLGLLGKMSGAAAVVSSEMTLLETGRIEIVSSLKALGVWGVYLSNLPSLQPSLESSILVTILGQVIPFAAVSISAHSPNVLEIDTQRAWTELGLKAGYSNEVQVKLSILP